MVGSADVLLSLAKYHPRIMRMELRDSNRRRLTRVEIDERARPGRVALPGMGQDLFPRWDEALDDASALRKCIVCGCTEMYTRKNLPQVTPVIVVLAFLGATVALLGYATNPLVIVLLGVLLAVDVLTLFWARRQLVCYGCGAIYWAMRIARYHHAWDRTVAERIGKEPIELPTVLIEAAKKREG